MPKKHEVCTSKYFRAADYPAGWTLTAEIETARLEAIGNGNDAKQKLVVYFRRQKPGLVCGPVLWDAFIELTDEEDSNDWPGHMAELYITTTTFGGKTVPCIRVRKPGAPAKKPKKAKSVTTDDDMDDEVAF
jgi:hypothetical protein